MKTSLRYAVIVITLFTALMGNVYATVTTETSTVTYACNGSTQAFTVPFPFFDDDDIEVITTDASNVEDVLTLTTDYTVSGGDGTTGTVTTVATYASTYSLTIRRDQSHTQSTDFVENDPFYADTIEDTVDRLDMSMAQIQEEVDRAMLFPPTSGYANVRLPLPSGNAYLKWNAAATALENVAAAATATIPTIDNIEDYSDDLDAAVTAIGASTSYLLIHKSITLGETTVVPENITLWITSEGNIVLGNYNLTVNSLVAGNYPIFNESGSGVVTLGPNAGPYLLVDWWSGTTTAAFQNAIDCAVVSGIPIQLLSGVYTVTSTLGAASGFNMRGVGCEEYGGANDATTIRYTGATALFKSTGKMVGIEWGNFTVDGVGNENANVDLFDFDYGVKQSHFHDIYVDSTTAPGAGSIRHNFIIRGQPAAGGAANNNQYQNHFDRVRVDGTGTSAIGLWGGTDLANGGFNGNVLTNFDTGANLDRAMVIVGNGNTWQGGVINANAGTYSVQFGPDSTDITYQNSFHDTYWDGTVKPVVFMVDAKVDTEGGTAYVTQAPAVFYNCIGINYSRATPHTASASTVHDYEYDGVTEVCEGCASDCERMMIHSSRYHEDVNTCATGYYYDIGRAEDVRIINGDITLHGGATSGEVGFTRNAANDLRPLAGDHFRANGLFGLGTAEAVQIAADGSLTITSSNVKADIDGGCAAGAPDNLDTITCADCTTGDIICIRSTDTTCDIVIRDNSVTASNIAMNGDTAFTLADTGDIACFFTVGTTYVQMFEGDN